MTASSQFLRESLKLVTLDHVADLVFAEVAKLYSTFEAGTHFFHVVLEAAQRRNPSVIYWLPFTKHAGPRRARHPAIGNEAARDDAFAKFKNLLHFGVPDDRFSMFRI